MHNTYTYRRFFFITITTITNTANNIIAIIGIITPATITPLPGPTGSLTTIQCQGYYNSLYMSYNDTWFNRLH